MLMDAPNEQFALAGSLEELKAKGRLVVHGSHRPILVIYDRGRVFALDNRCPHMGFPLERGSVEDGILTCHWHHARFDLESGCTFDLWADDVPICPVEVRNGDVWVKTTFTHADHAAWRQTATARRRGGNARRLEAGRIRPRSNAGCDVGQTCAIARRPSAPCSRRLRPASPRLNSLMPCSPSGPSGLSPTPGTRSI